MFESVLSSATCGSFLDSCLQTVSVFSDVELPHVFGEELKEASSAELTIDLGEKLSCAFIISFRGRVKWLRGCLGELENSSFPGLNS